MGNLEAVGRENTKRKNIRSFVLSSVALAGMLGVAVVAPNVLGAMNKLGFLPGKRQKEIINRARDRLVQQGFLKRVDGFLELTERGKKALQILEAREFQMRQPKRWDRKWRVLIFDIPEHRKSMRDRVRRTVETIGFVRLQDSVWIYPYDCEDLIALLKADFKIGKDMLYMIVEELEGDRHIKRHFGIH
jgi:DNA-binding transcriptional regulator PaaX